jgi:hypothetical protein
MNAPIEAQIVSRAGSDATPPRRSLYLTLATP